MLNCGLNWRMHPEEDELLRYCDGELRARHTRRVARHLEACWDCRTRVDDLRQTIAAYVRYRRDVLEPTLPSPPQPWRNLRAEFSRMPASGESGWKWSRILAHRTVWLAACTLTAGTGIVFYASRTRPLEHPAPPAARAPAPVRLQSEPPARRAAATLIPKSAAPLGPDDELGVIAALHRIGADLGDPIEVVRAHDRIVVTCWGVDAGRMREIRAALAGLPRVAVELSPNPKPPAAGAPLEVAGVPHSAAGAGPERQFDSPAAYDRFVDGLLKNSEALMARAHALRRLATRFPPGVEAVMSPHSQAVLESIRRQHETAFGHKVAALDRATQPYLGPPTPPPASAVAAEDWQTHAIRLFTEAEQVDRLLSAVTAGAQGAAVAEATPASLSSALAKLKADAETR